ncbi:conserved hypothetical protein [Candidatus Desulfosporosinus infrequens]|uniref:DUF4276 family protein n=1 Tax=Candidatus Desulfosporosinus infrequens TaxID=2043169 RepID=A0A2U3K6G3_9FIRM|nr:conserved hypothetical protein [Candidatus Desulfosporosinus infrequens]
MAKKVLLCGEGPTDYGRQKYGSKEWEEGPVQSIIRKSVQVDIEFTCVIKNGVRDVKIQRRTSEKLKGHAVKAYKLCVMANELGDIDNIVCYVDADRDQGSSKSARDAKKRVQDIYNEIQMGFAQFSATRSESSFPMIPLKMIESWLLADEIAFTACFGKPPTRPSLPRQPELIWGDENDPTSDHPKNYLKRVLEQYGEQGTIEIFICIAKNMTTDILRRKCPISFEQFYQDVQVIG